MTQGVIWKQLAYFALPLFLGNLCQQLYNTADSVIVGKFVGKDALAAVSVRPSAPQWPPQTVRLQPHLPLLLIFRIL